MAATFALDRLTKEERELVAGLAEQP